MGVKVRFDGLDVMAMVSHLNHVALGRRVINIYEGDTSEAFLFKLDHNATTNTNGNGNNNNNSGNITTTTTEEEQDKEKQKLMLYVESGIRFHCTLRQNAQTNTVGNSNNNNKHVQLAPFVFQLRKHLRGLRLEHVTQLGQGDRVVHFVFGMGLQRRALLLELYAKGNLVLCDAQYQILALLRSHQYPSSSSAAAGAGATTTSTSQKNTTTGTVQVQVGQVYPVTYAARTSTVMMTVNNTPPTSSSSDINNTEEVASEEEIKKPTTTTHEDLSSSSTAAAIVSVTAASSAEEWAAWAWHEVQQTMVAAACKTALDEEEEVVSQKNTTTNSNTKKGTTKKSKKDKQAGVITLKTLLLKPSSGISHYGPNFLEHCLLLVDNLQPHAPLLIPTTTNSAVDNNNNLPSLDKWKQFSQVLQRESARLDTDPKKANTAASPPKGYILYSDKTNNKNCSNNSNKEETPTSIIKNNNNNNHHHDESSFVDKVLEEFQPYLLLKQHQGRKVLEFDTFNEAVDTFFGHLEGQKRLLKAEAAEQTAADKLEKIRQDQEVRLDGLERELAKIQQQATVVEWNADKVEKALAVINSALDSGMDWDQLEQLIQVEQQENHNPIALLIYQLDLEQDTLVLELPTADYVLGNDDNDNDEEAKKEELPEQSNGNQAKKKKGKGKQNGKAAAATLSEAQVAKKKIKKNHILVTVSLKDSAHGNATQLFAKYRAMKEKSQRTVEASAKALKAAEETAQRQLADAKQRTQQATNTAVGNAKPPWFTKFHWFITSDNYLVLGGRDAHQNEVLVKKYLRPGDAYLHADVHGAASCILRAKRIRVHVKNTKGKKTSATTTQTLPLSDQALREAGNFTICRSSAWTSKMVTSGMWESMRSTGRCTTFC
jgi:predicted ribosome quality control (RQC) complex YloA/Tae2 family protein